MPKKIKEFSEVILIDKDKISYDNQHRFERTFAQFKHDNPGEWGEIKFKVIDKAEYYFHKYYRGDILKVVAQSKDQKDFYRVHTQLKADFKTIKIEKDLSEIPDKYMERGVAMIPEDQLYSFPVPSGRTIILLKDNTPISYIPSHAAYTNEEMKRFIEYAEAIRDGLIDWEVTPLGQAARDELFKDEQGEFYF